MKCLTRIEIQEFIDKEVEPSLMARISDHIQKCENCASLYREAVEDKGMINKLLGNTSDERISIPKFRQSTANKKNVIYRVAMVAAVAALLVLIFLFPFKREPISEEIPEAELLMYEFYDGKDLNELWHDKTQLLILQDEEGNVIQSMITN